MIKNICKRNRKQEYNIKHKNIIVEKKTQIEETIKTIENGNIVENIKETPTKNPIMDKVNEITVEKQSIVKEMPTEEKEIVKPLEKGEEVKVSKKQKQEEKTSVSENKNQQKK